LKSMTEFVVCGTVRNESSTLGGVPPSPYPFISWTLFLPIFGWTVRFVSPFPLTLFLPFPFSLLPPSYSRCGIPISLPFHILLSSFPFLAGRCGLSPFPLSLSFFLPLLPPSFSRWVISLPFHILDLFLPIFGWIVSPFLLLSLSPFYTPTLAEVPPSPCPFTSWTPIFGWMVRFVPLPLPLLKLPLFFSLTLPPSPCPFTSWTLPSHVWLDGEVCPPFPLPLTLFLHLPSSTLLPYTPSPFSFPFLWMVRRGIDEREEEKEKEVHR
jgi:hypothetical protein